ncbi:oxidoreductase [Motiliproteus sediminis]|uniref:oxidoreductase n=1 Tax=Motiliproteus sediminis TaxID=1468178 RepID=UPI001AEF7F35|nr:oxidoreductase [Motiliproteus sediminis]
MRRLRTLVIGFLLSFALPANAEGLPPPDGRVLLVVKGAIAYTNASGEAHFDRAMLDNLPQHGMTTATPWTEGKQRFEGPLLADLLQAVGAQGSELELTALNDYHATLHWGEVSRYPLVLVMRINGRSISVRQRGPIWLLYPMTDYPELNTPYHHSAMVWQLNGIEVRE